jgi:hypothetical protein
MAGTRQGCKESKRSLTQIDETTASGFPIVLIDILANLSGRTSFSRSESAPVLFQKTNRPIAELS